MFEPTSLNNLSECNFAWSQETRTYSRREAAQPVSINRLIITWQSEGSRAALSQVQSHSCETNYGSVAFSILQKRSGSQPGSVSVQCRITNQMIKGNKHQILPTPRASDCLSNYGRRKYCSLVELLQTHEHNRAGVRLSGGRKFQDQHHTAAFINKRYSNLYFKNWI